MDPNREPTAPGDLLTDDAVVAYLRTRAPGLPVAQLDARAVTARARGALRRRRRNSVLAAAGAVTACLALMVAGPVSVPLPDVGRLVPGRAPAPDQRQSDVDSLEARVLPVVEGLQVSYYLLEPVPCRILEYPRGDFRDGDPECGDLVPFDAQARADFDKVTDAVERSDVAVDRIFRQAGGIYVQLKDDSWRYNWGYVYLPDTDSPPATSWPGEEWTHIRDSWWLHRAHDD